MPPTPHDLESARRVLSWIDIGKSFALAFVAIGVAVEFLADRLERPYLQTIEDARQVEIEGLKSRTAEAERKSRELTSANVELQGEIDKAVAETNKQAQQAKLQQEALKRENLNTESQLLDLRARTAWREISEKQSLEIASKMVRFRGRFVVLPVLAEDAEAIDFANQIQRALSRPEAGIQAIVQRITVMGGTESSPVGLKMEVSDVTKDIADDALNDALKQAGVIQSDMPRDLFKDDPTPRPGRDIPYGTLVVWVVRKPKN